MTGLGALLLADYQYRADLREDNAQTLTQVSAGIRNRLQAALTTRLRVVEDLQAFMLAPASLPNNETFDHYAAGVLGHYPVIRGLAYIDSNRIIRYFYPLKGNQQAMGLDLMTRPAAPFVEKAIRERRTTVNDPTVTVQGSLAVTPRIPLYRGNQFLGLVQSVFDVSAILEEVSTGADPRFAAQLRDAKGHRFWGPDTFSGETQTLHVQVGDTAWTLNVGWQSLPPGPTPLTLGLIWGVGGALLLSLLFIVNRTWTQTERLRTAVSNRTAALRETEERYRFMADNASDMIYRMSLPDGRYEYVSPSSASLFGYSPDEFYNSPLLIQRVIHPDWRGYFEKAWADLLNGIALPTYEYQITRKSGEVRWLNQRNVLLKNESGAPIALQGIVTDITERKEAENALAQESRRNRLFLRSASDGVHILDADGKVLEVSDSFCNMLGYSRDELIGASPSLWDAQWSPQELKRRIAEQLAKGDRSVLETRHRRRDGSVFDVEITGQSLELDGEPVLFKSARDITDRKEAEARIAFLNRVYAVLSGINALIVRVHDRDELFREACRIAVETGGFRMSLIAIVDRKTMKIVPVASTGKPEELLTSINDILSSSERAPTTMVARAIREKKAVISNASRSDPQVLFGRQYAEAGVRSMAVLPLMVSDEAVGVLALYASEIEFFHEEELKLLTELAGDIAFAIDHIDKQERLDYLAYYDALTGLANRSLFLERLAQFVRSAVSGGHKLALFLIDLERFKNINDSLGRPAGDALLRQVTEWLARNIGGANLLARLDADHFAAVMPEVTHDGDVARPLEKIMDAFVDHPFRLNDAVFRIAARVGVAVFPDDGTDADTLFRNAEAALKKAKASGERYLFYMQQMTEAVAGTLTLENQLRQALDNEEFVLHYQPKVNLDSSKLTSAEALIRWNDPRTGLVPPGRFIPVLEETGLIYEVGRWALRQAIKDYLRWRAAGLPAVRIAVNVSPLQLRNRGFVDEIRQVIGIDAHAPAGLELEITESLIMADVKHSIASLRVIRDLDVRIAIDDFGTGFSSLSYLAQLPVHTLKIDRSFVIQMTVEPEGLALVSTIINLAHSLSLKVVAEGVETEEQSRLLRLLKCDEMQGFLFSKPVPAEIFETRFLAPSPAA